MKTDERERAGACEPAVSVLVVRRVGRPDERDDLEAAGLFPPERVETRPRAVVERLLEVAGDDGDAGSPRHTVARVWDLRTLCAVGRAAAGARRRHARPH